MFYSASLIFVDHPALVRLTELILLCEPYAIFSCRRDRPLLINLVTRLYSMSFLSSPVRVLLILGLPAG